MEKSKEELLQALEKYRSYLFENFPENSQEPVTKHEVRELGIKAYDIIVQILNKPF